MPRSSSRQPQDRRPVPQPVLRPVLRPDLRMNGSGYDGFTALIGARVIARRRHAAYSLKT
ncbi:hypothetical protein GOB93_05320 [Acetobacter musti]|uniref:Transposase n=1 Tax=Acetobacter musti TaxID=864732 RepID=A0ABX0JLF5_9PROT|nr:hypothetical protein [Acetobacter musti]NHN84062.1 hypothetical protein [Acetobacter musti]